MNQEIHIRVGREDDLPDILRLIKELATYEREPNAVTVTLDELKRDGFGPNAVYGFFVAELNQEIVGMALYYERYSTWKGRVLYLEDLVVSEAHRGKGIGGMLFRKMLELGHSDGYVQMAWQVLDWNTPAIEFYKKYQADISTEWLNGRISREQISRILEIPD